MRYESYTETFTRQPDGSAGAHEYHFKTILCPSGIAGKACVKQETITVKGEDLFKYNQGAYIQDAFPYLTASQRERFMTGICHPCFEELFKEEDADEYEED